ncbi:MAG: leucyl aminopeptidase [Dehalococcoidia bacterium]|nr:leucyl aminopeptidase [Dehalococcoidia bacterium]
MRINVVDGNIAEREDPAIVVNLFEGVTKPGGATGAVDDRLDGAITDLVEQGDISGKKGENVLIYTLGKLKSKRVIVAGLGKSEDFDTNSAREVHAGVARFLRAKGISGYATVLHGAGVGGLDAAEAAQAAAEGLVLGLYSFEKYKSNTDSKSVDTVNIVEFDVGKLAEVESGVEGGKAIAEAVNLAREMGNEPANYMTPTRMAEIALDVTRGTEMSLTVLDRSDIEELGMGSFAGVAQGTEEPPKFIVIRHDGDPDNPDNNLGLLGKGITFDSGGLDIKSAAGMLTMKSDMSGGACVIAAMKAIGIFNPRINVWGIVPATENMPGRRAQRPGDVVTAMNGKTIEIGNTDAEGRLVLADALCYAVENGVTRIVDVATLTGAIGVALGDGATGVFGNDQGWVDTVVEAGNSVGERMWQLPTYASYKSEYSSDIADIRNTGGRGAGAITGALIIGEFAGDSRWAHLDIAATTRTTSDRGINPKGSTGVPVRTLVELATSLASK